MTWLKDILNQASEAAGRWPQSVRPDKSGFENDPTFHKPCMNQSHEPPSHLYIEPGKQYRHVCPGCGQVTILRPPNIWC